MKEATKDGSDHLEASVSKIEENIEPYAVKVTRAKVELIVNLTLRLKKHVIYEHDEFN